MLAICNALRGFVGYCIDLDEASRIEKVCSYNSRPGGKPLTEVESINLSHHLEVLRVSEENHCLYNIVE